MASMFMAVLAICLALSHVPNAEALKNVLLIIADDMRPDINFYSELGVRTSDVSTTFHTPNLDALGRKSLVMTKAYAQVALCGPSRSSFLTSRYPDTIQCIGNSHKFRDIKPDIVTLPQYFREKGYNTQGMGKVFHGDGDENRYGLSWTEFTSTGKPYKDLSDDSWMAINDTQRRALPTGDDLIRDAALTKLEEVAPAALDGSQNFFMAVGFHKPHLPFNFPEEFLNYYPEPVELPPNREVPTNYPDVAWSRCSTLCSADDVRATGIDCSDFENSFMPLDKTRELRRAYFSCVSYIDSLVGDVLQKLENLSLSDNTVVAFMSDHGWKLMEHNAWCKTTNFEADLRIPLMLHVPGDTDNGLVTDKLVEAIDVYPTLVEAAGLTPMDECKPKNPLRKKACTEGNSMMELVRDPDSPTWKREVYSQTSRDLNSADARMGYSMTDGNYRYTHYVDFDNSTWTPLWEKYNRLKRNGIPRELYNLTADPFENENLINSRGKATGDAKPVEKELFKLLKKFA